MSQVPADLASEEFIERVSQGVAQNVLRELRDAAKGSPLSLPPEKSTEVFLTRQETADYLKISLVTLHKLVNQGKLKAYGRGTRYVRFLLSEIVSARTKF